MKVRKKPVIVEAFTFDEFVEYGLRACSPGTEEFVAQTTPANIVDGVPWAFSFRGHAVTHENDDRYIIPTMEGQEYFSRGFMLMVGVWGEIYPCREDIFKETYEPVEGEG